MKNLIFIDFETFYDSKDDYDLRKFSLVEYVRDARFSIQGLAIAGVAGFASWWSNPTEYDIDSVDWKNTIVVAHNIKFDGFILSEKFGVNPYRWVDTKAMAKAVLGKTVKGFSLRELAEHFGLEAKGTLKTDGLKDLSPEQEKQLADYCNHDVELCREIYMRLEPDFPEGQYEMMDWTIRTFVNPKLQLNVSLLAEAAQVENKRRENIFYDIGIAKADFASNVKFAKLLESEGYEVPTKLSPRTGQSIPALALGDVGFIEMAESNDPRLLALCEARIAAKSTLLETRTSKMAAIGKTGAWPFDIEFSGATQTHRFSGSNGAGGNPQNFTRGSVLRDAVEAPAGYKLVIGDFSNIELRLVAYLSQDPGLIQALEAGVDLYCDFASAFYGQRITKENKAERQFGKTAILGLGYGMGAKKFRNTVRIQTGQDITEEDAERAVNLYRRRYTRVPALWEHYQEQIARLADPFLILSTGGPINFEQKQIGLPSGLKIRYPNLREVGRNRRGDPEWAYDVWKKRTEKETVKLYGGKVLENISQALAGELCKEAAVRFKSMLTGLVHDEIHLCVPSGLAPMYASRLKRAMETPPSWLPQMKLGAEVHIGKTWGSCK